MNDDTLRIIAFKAENFKGLKVIDVRLDDAAGLVEVRGPNGAGKTSVLDAIMCALGGKKLAPDKPIRAGEDRAMVRLELAPGPLTVERVFDKDGSRLTVTGENGVYRNGQEVLDALLGHLGFDPTKFLNMKAQDQATELAKVVGLADDLERWAMERQAAYDARRDANREVKKLEAKLQGMTHYPGVPEEPISITALAVELEGLLRLNQDRDKARERRVEIKAQIAKLEDEYEDLERIAERAPENVAALQNEVADADETNKKVDANRARAELEAELAVATTAAVDEDAKVKDVDDAKAVALAAAAFPLEGLTFGDDGLLYNGIPLEQCAASERLRVAVAVAMAANPKLRLVLWRDGSLLDKENVATLAVLARERDYVVWLERVDDGAVGVIITEDNGGGAAAEGKLL